jgi:ankyrin repeat protein
MKNKLGRNCAHVFAKENYKSFECLLKSDKCSEELINNQDEFGDTCLHIACKYNLVSLEKIIESKYFTNQLSMIQNKNGYSPAHYIVRNGDLKTLKLFMEYGLRLDCVSKMLGNMNLIHFAFRESSNDELIKYLIELDQFLDVDVQPNIPSEQLIYQNKYLTKQQKQELVYLYLNKWLKRQLL